MLGEQIRKNVELLICGKIDRDEISSWSISIIKNIEAEDEIIDNEIFQFLLFLSGYDTPDFDKEFLFDENDLLREFNKIKHNI